MLDTLIENGTLIDGSGAARRRADVGVRDGRIVAIGEISEAATQTVDASGRIVCPGFVDAHTHYDAQVFWDPALTPSSTHGVTSVIAGNCGFTIAPLSDDPADADYLIRMLARVEGMPLGSLQKGVPWGSWKSFGEYLDVLSGTLAINAGFLVGHTALRRTVMGARSVNHEATPAEIESMQELLRTSIREGGLGFSTTLSVTHNDAAGDPVPSRAATDEELYALADVVSEFSGTSIMLIPGVGSFDQETIERMTNLSLRAKRPINWNLLNPVSAQREVIEAQLAVSDYAAARGARILALTVPQAMSVRLNFLGGFALDALPGWSAVIGLPVEERKKALADPVVRKKLDDAARSEEAGPMAGLANWGVMTIVEVFKEEHERFVGMTVAEIAEEQGKQPFDALLDLVVADDLKTYFKPPIFGDDDESWQMRGEAWTDERTVVGASDAGAHLDMIDTFAFSTQILGEGRRRKLITTEEAVHQLTEVPAKLFGLRERGLVAEGYHADIVVFDEETVETGPIHVRYDLPCGSPRLFADAVGIEHVFVNGQEIVRGTDLTGEFPGQIIRPGADTDTVTIPAEA